MQSITVVSCIGNLQRSVSAKRTLIGVGHCLCCRATVDSNMRIPWLLGEGLNMWLLRRISDPLSLVPVQKTHIQKTKDTIYECEGGAI